MTLTIQKIVGSIPGVGGIDFVVSGIPAPQGSKTPWGSEANPRTRPWRAAVTARAAEVMGDRDPHRGPVKVICTFYFPRPKSHYRTGKNAPLLKDSAPVVHTQHPDLDKLQRAIGDSLSGVAFADDKQIYAWDVAKLWGERGEVIITVRFR